MIGLLIGAPIGLVIGGFGGGVVAYTLVKHAERSAKSGWVLTPAAVAARGLAAGGALTFEDLSQRAIPIALATKTTVELGSVNYVVGQTLGVPLAAGQPLRWTHIHVSKQSWLQPGVQEGVRECTAGMAASRPFAPTIERLRFDLTKGGP